MKRILIVSLGLGLAALVAAPAFSQTIGIEAHGLYAFEFDGDLNPGQLEPEDSFGAGVAFVVAVNPYLKLDLGIDYLKADLKDSNFAGVKGGDIEMIPVTVGVRAGPTVEFAFLYAGAGIGYSFNNWGGGVGEGFVTLEDCVTYYACLGAELSLTDSLVLRPELRYTILKPELKGTEINPFGPGTSWEKDWTLDHFEARLGLGVYF